MSYCPPHYHVPIRRPRKKKRVTQDEKSDMVVKHMVKNGKLSRKGKNVSWGKCGAVGHNKRAFIGPRNQQPHGKSKKQSRAEGVPDVEPTEVASLKSGNGFPS
ncbi:hypothetical protein Tco_0260603 [Tanacetum coccineum]